MTSLPKLKELILIIKFIKVDELPLTSTTLENFIINSLSFGMLASQKDNSIFMSRSK